MSSSPICVSADVPGERLTDEQLSELRGELERELTRLRRSIVVSDEATKTVELDQTAVGRLSRMDSLQSQGIAKGLREREKIRLSLILEALRRMDEGVYGSCDACGEPIAMERLYVFPESTTCVRCAG